MINGQIKTLETLFLSELADIYDAEKQIVKAMPKMAKAATCEDLKETTLEHLSESKIHLSQLEEVFACFNQTAHGETNVATIGLLKEGEEIAQKFKGSPAINAALIAAAQKIKHYEIATYSCLFDWADLLGNKKAASILKQILKEAKSANKSLNELAHSWSNAEAMGGELIGAES